MAQTRTLGLNKYPCRFTVAPVLNIEFQSAGLVSRRVATHQLDALTNEALQERAEHVGLARRVRASYYVKSPLVERDRELVYGPKMLKPQLAEEHGKSVEKPLGPGNRVAPGPIPRGRNGPIEGKMGQKNSLEACPRSMDTQAVWRAPEEEIYEKLKVELLPYDSKVADEALDALAEYLVSMWVATKKSEGHELPPDRG